MTKALTWVVLFIITVGGSMAHAVTISASSPFDTRCFSAFLKGSGIPDWNFDTGTAVSYSLRQYGAAGDDNVTQSPVCADVNPAITISAGSLPTGTTLTTTNLNNATISGTPSSTGAVSFTVSYDNSVGAAVTDAVAGTITAAGGTGVPIANGTASGVSRFVDCNASAGGGGSGSDLLDGRTPSTPWGSISKVNSLFIASGGVAAGTDLWFKAGSTCKEVPLSIGLSGTSSDHVRMGTYYVSGGVAYESTPTNPTAWPLDFTYTNGVRAIIKGTCDSDTFGLGSFPNFTPNPNCIYKATQPLIISTYVFNLSSASGSLPSVWTQPLVSIAANYVDVEDLEIRGSAGRGMQIEASGPVVGDTKGWTDITLQRLKFYHGFSGALYVNWGRRITLRDSIFQRIGAGNNPDTGGAQNGVVRWNNAHGTNVNNYLSEGNEISQNYNENHDIFYHPVSMIIRGNRIGDNTNNHSCIYGDDGNGIVIEYNICYIGTYNTDSSLYAPRGIGFTYEPLAFAARSAQLPLENLLMRGNMFSGAQVGVTFEDNLGPNDCKNLSGCSPPVGDRRMSGRVYNNTFINLMEKDGVDTHKLYKTIGGGVEIKNNIFSIASIAHGTDACSIGDSSAWGAAHSTPFVYTFSNNLWSAQPPALTPTSTCRGANDAVGTPVVAGGSEATMLAKNSSDNRIAPTDFVLQAGSPGLAIGTPLTTTLLNTTTDYPQYSGISVPCATFDTAGSLIDAVCVTRNASAPDAGALERP